MHSEVVNAAQVFEGIGKIIGDDCEGLGAHSSGVFVEGVGEIFWRGVEEFSPHHGAVVMVAEMKGEEGDVFEGLGCGPGIAVVVDAGRVRGSAGKKGGARGIADGGGGVGVGEQGTAGGETIDVRRDGVGMAIETTDPVVHVVDGDKENIGECWRRGEGAVERENQTEKEDEFHRSQARKK